MDYCYNELCLKKISVLWDVYWDLIFFFMKIFFLYLNIIFLYLNVKKKFLYKEVLNFVYNEYFIRYLFFLDMIYYDNDLKIGKI